MDQSRNILLVEGQDDKHVVRHLLDQASLQVSLCIRDKEGIENLTGDISTEIKVPGRAAIGIVVDANDDLGVRWDAISHQLREANIGGVPGVPSPCGTIVDAAPRIGVWLMPDNRSTGELEDFVQEMIPDDDPVWPLAQGYVRGIPQEARKFSPKKTSRAELHAWLATREEPGFMGSAIGRGDLKADGELCSAFLAWLEGLFG